MRKTAIAAGVFAALAAGNTAALTITQQWTHTHSSASGSAAASSEINAYDAATDTLWVVGPGGVDVLNRSSGARIATIPLTSVDGVAYGTANSVAIRNGIAVVAVDAATRHQGGEVFFFDTTSRTRLSQVTVGAVPDMVVFADDHTVLVANEGEPQGLSGAGVPTGIDPAGSVSIIDITNVAAPVQQVAEFTAFDGATLRADGVRIGPYIDDADVAKDLEPEYIAVAPDGSRAFVTLQENNAIGVLDLGTGEFTDIIPLGFKDHSLAGNGLDASDRDGPGTSSLNGNIKQWPLLGMYMPDGIASYEVGGVTYFLTANEGDVRDGEESRVGAVDLDDAVFGANEGFFKDSDNLGRIDISRRDSDTDGDNDMDRLVSYGARSFSIFDADGTLVFDSGDMIERLVFDLRPDLWADGRSDNKGPEPEGIALLDFFGSSIALVGLERSNALIAFDVTDPFAPDFLTFIDHAGDVGPEGITAFGIGDRRFLAVSNEVSRTTTLYQVPEPAAGALLLLGLPWLLWRRSRAA